MNIFNRSVSLSGKKRERVGVCGEVQSWLLVGNPAHQVKTVDNKLLVAMNTTMIVLLLGTPP